ncbi:MAG: ABC transporter ATP-binding protein [Oscillospiraceae bacterium]|nr:ABC transporter ATP-binding protein [Oscillospiraceae bacterium]
MDKKLEVKNLQISFRTQGGILKAVRNISFDLYKGETLAIVGESGSGKSVTSKAIMGILAGNSIVEGGEILYDGQDLLKISEDDFHKLRGDKVAMIFQDPMSSLNPIMRVGQQLTEAMILKAKAGKRNAKREFNSKLKLLGDNINAANRKLGVDASAQVAEKLKKFDTFCISATKIEGEFNEAYTNVMQLEVEIEDAILVLRKQKKVDTADIKRLQKLFAQAYNPYVIVKNEQTDAYAAKLAELASAGKDADSAATLAALEEIHVYLESVLEQEKPNFFTLGYYKMVRPNEDLSKLPVAEMNRVTRKFLDEDFLFDFIAMAEKGVSYAHNESIAKKNACLPALKEALDYFKAGKIEHGKANSYCKTLSEQVSKAVDRLSVKKNSAEYVFHSALANAIDGYFEGVKKNPIEEKVYLRNKKKYDAIIAKGKQPDWVLTPQVVIDLDLKLANICKVIENLYNSYSADIANTVHFNANAGVIDIIDFLKEQASRLVVKMNKRIAKAKAIKLLEEVGIPEPTTRYRQYPFEFSGGMRQRIVIAIALSANPDILICDEPTTALDVTIQAQILELINSIKKERNLSVIFITHNMGVVANMADRVAVMYAGKIVEHGTAEEIFYEPAHPYTWALLSSMPDLHTTERLESIPGTPPNMIYPPKGDAFAARNKYALEIDFEQEPPLFEVTPTHYAATWLLHPNAPQVEMPALIKARIERLKKERE